MNYDNNYDEDEELNLAIKASLDDLNKKDNSQEDDIHENMFYEDEDQNLENPYHKDDEDDEDDSDESSLIEDISDTEYNIIDDSISSASSDSSASSSSSASSASSLVNNIQPPNDDINIAIQASLLNYENNDEELLKNAIIASLASIEEDRKNKLKKQEEEDYILSKTITESYYSNVSVQFNSGSLIESIDNSIDNSIDDATEAEYMRVILQEIKESEERDSKTKKIKQSRTIIEQQDFEYEEALRKDKEKFEAKVQAQVKEKTAIMEKEKEQEIEDKPKTKEEMRKARLEFFQGK